MVDYLSIRAESKKKITQWQQSQQQLEQLSPRHGKYFAPHVPVNLKILFNAAIHAFSSYNFLPSFPLWSCFTFSYQHHNGQSQDHKQLWKVHLWFDIKFEVAGKSVGALPISKSLYILLIFSICGKNVVWTGDFV